MAGFLLGVKIFGAIVTLLTALFGVFKVIGWVKNQLTKIDNNVVELKASFDKGINDLREDVKDQTKTIATALSEQRSDFRTFYAPTLLLMQQNAQLNATPAVPVRAKRPVKRRTKKKKPAIDK